MNINSKSLPYILLQRTQYIEKTFSYKLLGKILRAFNYSDLHSIVYSNSYLNPKGIRKSYRDDMEFEYKSISNHLPDDAKSILDIGCGLAGIDYFISKHYSNECDIYLLDKSVMDDSIHFGFEKEGSFYNSLEMSKKLLNDNGIPDSKIFLQEVTPKNEILFDENFDLIISLISWGFHYPVGTYLDQVLNKLKPKGILIIDVRKETDGINELKNKFKTLEIIGEYEKHHRVKCKKIN